MDVLMIVTFFLRRANEENNKLKTRYEQAKEEIENLVSKLNITYVTGNVDKPRNEEDVWDKNCGISST